MKQDNKNKKIRKYRRLRRKAKRLRIFRFIFKKIIPFAVLRLLFKKYFSWITILLFSLGLFYNAGNQFSTEQFIKLQEYQNQLIETKQEVNKLKLFIDEQNFPIISLQKEVFNWSQKCNQLVETNEQNYKSLEQKNIKLESKLQKLKDLQIENIKMRNQIQNILNDIKKNALDIKQTEKEIASNNKVLKDLSVALVSIANETTRQHSIYKRSCSEPLNEIDSENLLEESISFNLPEIENLQEIEDLLSAKNELLQQSDMEI